MLPRDTNNMQQRVINQIQMKQYQLDLNSTYLKVVLTVDLQESTKGLRLIKQRGMILGGALPIHFLIIYLVDT